MNILISFNDAYVFPTKVMLKSLILHSLSELDIYVIYEELSDASIEEIKELEDANVRFHFNQIDYGEFGAVPVVEAWSKDAYVRLFAQYYLDEVLDRVLYLDGDIIVNASLDSFYNQEFYDKYYVAVEDSFLGKDLDSHRKLGLPFEYPYVCSGVLLINLRRLRKCVEPNTISEYVHLNKEILSFFDQDVLNGLFYQHIKVVDGFGYNFFPAAIRWCDRNEWNKTASIVHYAGPWKPWKRRYRYPGYRLWWKYAFMLGEGYKKLYRRNYLSCMGARLEHNIALLMMDKAPSFFDVVAKLYRKLNRKTLCKGMISLR